MTVNKEGKAKVETLDYKYPPIKIAGLTPTILVMNDAFYLPYVLESLRGRFERYVIYDAGSEDGTLDIIDWFVETEAAEFFIRKLPFAIPSVQGCYRNSMLVEAQSEWTFMVDGDEIYTELGLDWLSNRLSTELMPLQNTDLKYGVVKRTEIATDLLSKYNVERTHHRLYHRTAIFRGSHPGEVPVFKQQGSTEYNINEVMCYHFHNAVRSPLDLSVPKRIDRKSQGTYHPGDLIPFNLLEELPLLKNPINNFPVSPALERLQYAAIKM